MNKINCITLDLDGTLLNADGNISANNLKGVQHYMNLGYHVCLASGRPYRLLDKYVKEIGLQKDDYVICRDGQFIYDGEGTLIHSERLMTSIDYRNIIDILPKQRMSAFTDKIDFSFAPSILEYAKMIFFNRNNSRISVVREVPDGIDDIEKIKIYADDLPVSIIENIRRKYSIHQILGDSYEINTLGVNKYSALKYLESMEKITINSIVYFGDDHNDTECFENLPFCIAMGNAVQAIKEKAVFVTKDNNDDGVLFALEKIPELVR